MIECKFENGNIASPGLRHVCVDNIVLDKDRQKILLVRRSNKFSHPNKLAMPGGFLDRGDSTEQSALREIKEETGYNAKILNLFCIVDDPNREGEDRQNVTFVFVAEALEKESEFDHEVTDVQWFDLDNLPDKNEFAFDHYQRIEGYLNYLKNPQQQLPLIISK